MKICENKSSKRENKQQNFKFINIGKIGKMVVVASLCTIICTNIVSCTYTTKTPDNVSTPDVAVTSKEQSSLPAQSKEESSWDALSVFPNDGIIGDTKNTCFPNYPTVTAFLEKFNFADVKPFFTFDHSNRLDFNKQGDTKKVELYYSKTTQKGCVIIYDAYETRGIAFNEVNKKSGTKEPSFFNPFIDPFNTDPLSGDISESKSISNYKEKIQKRKDGKITHFVATASDNMYSGSKTEELYSYTFFYRKDGSLEKKSYNHDENSFGTTHSYRIGYYDTAQRLVYEDSYITHGHFEYYTIYMGESKTPSYRLQLDFGGGDSNLIMYE